MNKLLHSLALAFAFLFLFATPTGCALGSKPKTVEAVAFTSTDASDIAAYGALKVWADGYAKRLRANDKTKQSDPGGYLERRLELVKEQGRVSDLRSKYSASVALVIEGWVAAKRAGLPTPPEPIATTTILTLKTEIELLNK
jgi:hypothetical protein